MSVLERIFRERFKSKISVRNRDVRPELWDRNHANVLELKFPSVHESLVRKRTRAGARPSLRRNMGSRVSSSLIPQRYISRLHRAATCLVDQSPSESVVNICLLIFIKASYGNSLPQPPREYIHFSHSNILSLYRAASGLCIARCHRTAGSQFVAEDDICPYESEFSIDPPIFRPAEAKNNTNEFPAPCPAPDATWCLESPLAAFWLD